MYRTAFAIILVGATVGISFFLGYGVGAVRRPATWVEERAIEIHKNLMAAALGARQRGLVDDAMMLESVAEEVIQEVNREGR